MLKYVGSNSTTLAAHGIKGAINFLDDQLNEVGMYDVSHYQTGLNYNFLLCYKTILNLWPMDWKVNIYNDEPVNTILPGNSTIN